MVVARGLHLARHLFTLYRSNFFVILCFLCFRISLFWEGRGHLRLLFAALLVQWGASRGLGLCGDKYSGKLRDKASAALHAENLFLSRHLNFTAVAKYK